MYDIGMMQELGYCSGIENYSRVIEGRPVGSPPNTLMDYFALEVGGQILGHTLGEGRHKNPLVPGGAGVDFADEVINLPFHRADLLPQGFCPIHR